LKKWSNGTKILSDCRLYEECMLPESVTLHNGFVLTRPEKWK
jgi:hypothetical protein